MLTALLVIIPLSIAAFAIRKKNIQIWLWSYLRQRIKHLAGRSFITKPGFAEPVDVLFCMVDHFEPKWCNPTANEARKRVQKWLDDYPVMAKKHLDSDGYHPRHTWFYPQEEYESEYLEMLSRLCKGGFGEIEIHLHHNNDTSDGFRKKLIKANRDFRTHGACITMGDVSHIAYGFVHGNWALDNSHPKGSFCGVNNEITILSETGCYADFTLPSAPSPCQTKKINSIYYALDNPNKPKSHNTGKDVRVGAVQDRGLMIIQGPLTLNLADRKYGVWPRIENGEISGSNPGTLQRIDLWVKEHIHVRGRKEWIFVKVHCHGAQEGSWNVLLGTKADEMYHCLERKYNDGKNYRLHYVTARECYNIIKAAEAGETGNPGKFRDYLLKPYKNSGTDNKSRKQKNKRYSRSD